MNRLGLPLSSWAFTVFHLIDNSDGTQAMQTPGSGVGHHEVVLQPAWMSAPED